MKDRFSAFILVRLFFYLLFTALFGLLYWSNLLQEERLVSIQSQVEKLENSVQQISLKPSCTYTDPRQKNDTAYHSYDNLLQKDPYSTKILPTLLGNDFIPKGTLRMATIGTPDTLHPFSQWAQVVEWMNYCQATVAKEKFGYYEELAQDFALRLEERQTDRPDRVCFWVHLRRDLYWQPLEQRHFSDEIVLDEHFLQKHPVTAHDFKFYFDALQNPHVDLADAVSSRFLLRDIEHITVIDDYTLAVCAKKVEKKDSFGNVSFVLPYTTKFYIAGLRPLARFVYQYNPNGTKIAPNDSFKDFYQTSSLWAERFVHHFASRVIVSCGPWLFDGMTKQGIRFRKNPQFYNPYSALYQEMEIYFLESPDAIFREFVAQKIDLCVISPQDLIELDRFTKSDTYAEFRQKGMDFNRLDYLQRTYSYIAWNQKNRLFESKKVRQAVTLAIDRNRLIRQNLQGQAIVVTGPFFVSSEGYNETLEAFPYDPDQAKRMLAEEGWFDSNADGILEKVLDGNVVSFRFRLSYYVKNPISKANAELIALFLKEIGIECTLNGIDLADLSMEFEDKSFDALLLAWSLTSPPEDPRQLWHSESADEKSSSNIVGFRNKTVDLLIEQLQYEHDKEKRKELLHKIHEVIHDEMPYTFLYTPKATLVWWNWIHNIFIPKERQDILPGATQEQPATMYSWRS
jgi:peptide/nickel transport system substrate-binding protein